MSTSTWENENWIFDTLEFVFYNRFEYFDDQETFGYQENLKYKNISVLYRNIVLFDARNVTILVISNILNYLHKIAHLMEFIITKNIL